MARRLPWARSTVRLARCCCNSGLSTSAFAHGRTIGYEDRLGNGGEAASVTAGIHIDHAMPEQVEELYRNCLAAADAACEAYEGNRP